jgi:hypothetical protein
MRKIFFLFAASLTGLTACNNSGSEDKAAIDTAAAQANHDSMHHAATTTSSIAPLPEVPAGAKVFFKNLKDGQTVSSPLKIEMGVEGMSVDTANGIIKPASGHHHILVNTGDSIPSGETIVKDSVHVHFGNAQTSAELKLQPGKNTLVLQFADALHRSYGSRLTSKVTVNVKK